jgi:hypothetical protein
MKHPILFTLALLAGAAHADCEPAKAIGAIQYQPHPSGALLIAYRCPDLSTVAFAARPEWKPLIPPWPAEVGRLRTLSGYDGVPNPLNLEAAKLLLRK